MKWYEKTVLVVWLSFCFAVMTKGVAWAGDCSSPDDCRGVPDNNTRTAGIGGGIVGGGLAYRKYRKRKRTAPPADKSDPCAAQQGDVSAAQGNVDMYARQRQTYLDQMTADAQQTSADNAAAQAALAALKSAVSGNLGGMAILAAANLPSDLADCTQSQLNTISLLGNTPQAAAFVQAVNQLLQDVAKFNNDKGLWQKTQDNYEQAQQALQQAEKALQDCRNSQRSADGNQSVASGDSGQGDGGSEAS